MGHSKEKPAKFKRDPLCQVDRNDDDVSSSSGGGNDDLDEALGTLMAYGGKYLRQLGAWAFEYGTQTSADVLNQSALPDPQSGRLC